MATVAVVAIGMGKGASPPPARAARTSFSWHTPIRHVVVVYQENHSFDNVLGRWCVQSRRCAGTTTGRLPGGAPIRLRTATDIAPPVGHEHANQTTAIDGGRMDGWSRIPGCSAPAYACLTEFAPAQIPNLVTLASRFVVSDATFEAAAQPSWGSHLELVAGRLDGFVGDNPIPSITGAPPGFGWGCDSRLDAMWRPSAGATARPEPACVPMKDGRGPYRPSPVSWVPTVMDRMDQAGLRWRIYETSTPKRGPPYGWAICPTFADCLDTAQRTRMAPSAQVLTDARTGHLPNLALVMPSGIDSQHNQNSMLMGDNWIARVVSAVESGPDWSSTALFIAYDDCGCFYDHVPPPPGLGIRVPVVIVSPYARAHFTDHDVASLSSILAYVDHVFQLPPLGADATAYPYSHAFDYHQRPLTGVPLHQHPVSRAERAYLSRHPAPPDAT